MLKPMKHMGHTRDLRHNNDIFKKSIITKSMPKPTGLQWDTHAIWVMITTLKINK